LSVGRWGLGRIGPIGRISRIGPIGLARPPTPNTQRPNPLLEFEAIHLFVERAAAVSPGFKLGERNAAATVRICRRLDGIPLAIELAAARLKVLSVEQIAVRLDDRFQLLTGGSRAALPRQQTLRATLDWSYDLLSEPERILLRRLSVFTRPSHAARGPVSRRGQAA
jgi:predicted ATPase